MKKSTIITLSVLILAVYKTVTATTLFSSFVASLTAIVTLCLTTYFLSLSNGSLPKTINTPVQKDAPVIKKQTEEELETIRHQRELELARIKALEEKRKIEEAKKREKDAVMWARIREAELGMESEYREWYEETKRTIYRKHNYKVATGIFEGCC